MLLYRPHSIIHESFSSYSASFKRVRNKIHKKAIRHQVLDNDCRKFTQHLSCVNIFNLFKFLAWNEIDVSFCFFRKVFWSWNCCVVELLWQCQADWLIWVHKEQFKKIKVKQKTFLPKTTFRSNKVAFQTENFLLI